VVEYREAEYRPSCRPELVEGRAREITNFESSLAVLVSIWRKKHRLLDQQNTFEKKLSVASKGVELKFLSNDTL